MDKNEKDLEIERLNLKLERERKHRRHLEDQYEKNKFLLQSTKEEIEKLVFQVTHDLKAPVSSFGQLVEEVLPLLPLNRRNVFLSSIARIQDICKEVLKRHRMIDSTQPIDKTKKAVDIVALIESIVEEKQAHFRSQGIKFDIHLNGLKKGEEYANLREVELTCILFNTLENSIEAIKEKGSSGVIKVSIKKLEKEYQLIIQDNGIGIHPDKINKIGKYGVTFKKSGNGLGLYSSLHYLHKRGGDIKISSKLKVGTDLVITVPFGEKSNKKIDIDPNSLVIIVDDDVLIHESIRLFFEESAFKGEILDFYTEEEFRSWHGVFGNETARPIFYIVDGFIQSHYPNGPQLIKDLGIINNSIIYTGKQNLMPTATEPLKVFEKGLSISEILNVH